jgi:serine/threonine protein kinase
MELLTPEQRALFDEGRSLDDYEVLKPIGKGKFSVVYKAKRLRDEKLVALKKVSIFDMMDAKAREKTLKEVRIYIPKTKRLICWKIFIIFVYLYICIGSIGSISQTS